MSPRVAAPTTYDPAQFVPPHNWETELAEGALPTAHILSLDARRWGMGAGAW